MRRTCGWLAVVCLGCGSASGGAAGPTDDATLDGAPDTSVDARPEAAADGGSEAPGDAPASDDGSRALPTGAPTIGMWCGVPSTFMSKARFDEIAAAGFTFAINACDGATYTKAYDQQMLDLAHGSGLQAVVFDQRVLDAVAGKSVAANLDAVVADYAKSPGLQAYFVTDEPGVSAFPALASVVSGLGTRDPAHAAWVNLLPDYATTAQLGAPTYDDYVATFLDVVAPPMFSWDYYPLLSDGTDSPSYFANLAVARAHAIDKHVPFWQFIQSISYSGHRPATEAEKRWQALHTLAYGGTGVLYFTYWTPPPTSEAFGDGIIDATGKPSSQYAEVQSINREIRAIGGYLVPATSTAVFHQGPLGAGALPRVPGAPVYLPSAAPITVGLFTVAGTDAYALLVNRDHGAATESDVWLTAVDALPESLDVATGTFRRMTVLEHGARGAKVHVALAAGDGLLIHLHGPLPAGPPGAEAYFGTVRADAGWLDVVDASFGTARLRTAGWNDCPAGYALGGRDFQSNGFWLCVREDLVGHGFVVGNVVSDAGTAYTVKGGVATRLGAASWDTCSTGKLLGRRFDSNGYWVCMD